MSQENVEIVMSLYPVAQRRESPFAVVDEKFIWDMSGFGLPGAAKVYRGHNGIREFWGDWLVAWETTEVKVLSAEDHGDHVIVEVERRSRGRTSGVAVDFHYFQAFTVRGGRVMACYTAETRAEALEAVGLSE